MVSSREIQFEAEDRHARTLVKDLHSPRAAVYWTDFLLTASIGWVAFAVSAALPFSATTVFCVAASALALYRGLCFLHEITHLNRRSLRAFEPVWNILIGYPLLMPSFVYVGVHQAHHSPGTYGTKDDPEYLPFSKSKRMTLLFAAESVFIPAALLIRFLVVAPMGLCIPRFERWLAEHASSLTMNFAYRRPVTPDLLSRIQRDSAFILMLWIIAIAYLPPRVFILWFAVVSAISFINTVRTLAAHRYEGDGNSRDRSGQLLDSVDVPGRIWTELWAPVGLRYHALHHYFPGIPYHNLAEAHRRLIRALPEECLYRTVRSRSLAASLHALLQRGSQTRD